MHEKILNVYQVINIANCHGIAKFYTGVLTKKYAMHNTTL